MMRKETAYRLSRSVLALPIFPVRLQTSIFGASELNFRVRDGNGWTLTAINTNLLFLERKSKQKELYIRLGLDTLFFVQRPALPPRYHSQLSHTSLGGCAASSFSKKYSIVRFVSKTW